MAKSNTKKAEVKEITVKVDLDQMTFGDMETLAEFGDRAEGETMEWEEMKGLLSLLDRLVVGGVRDLPITSLPLVLAELERVMGEQFGADGRGN